MTKGKRWRRMVISVVLGGLILLCISVWHLSRPPHLIADNIAYVRYQPFATFGQNTVPVIIRNPQQIIQLTNSINTSSNVWIFKNGRYGYLIFVMNDGTEIKYTVILSEIVGDGDNLFNTHLNIVDFMSRYGQKDGNGITTSRSSS